MDFVSVRVITQDVERLASFWERVTGLPVSRPVPVFAELRTPTGTIAIGAPATVGMLGDAAPVPGQNRSVLVELRVDDVDATWERVKGLVPQTVPEIVLEPADMPWGNRSMILATRTADWSTSSPPSPRRRRRRLPADPSLRGAAHLVRMDGQTWACSSQGLDAGSSTLRQVTQPSSFSNSLMSTTTG